MNPLPLILLVGIGVVAVSLFKTGKAAVNLQYVVTRFGIYKFASDGAMTLRVRVRFTNANNTPLHINLFDIQAYLNPTMNGNSVVSRGSLIASLSDASGFIIMANSFTEKDFYINVRWADIGMFFLSNITDIVSVISGETSIRDFLTRIVGTPVLVLGTVKAENVVFPIQQVVSLQNDVA